MKLRQMFALMGVFCVLALFAGCGGGKTDTPSSEQLAKIEKRKAASEPPDAGSKK